MRTDNSIEIWLSKNDRDLDYYKAFLEKFGDEEFLAVAFGAVNIFTKDRIQYVNTIAEKLKKLEGIVRVISIADVFKDKVTSPVFRKKIRSQQGRPLMNIFKQQLLTDPLYQNTIISQNGKTTAIIATVKCAGPESRKQLVSDVRKILHETTVESVNTENRKHKYHLAGPTVVNAELDRMSKQDMAKFTPLMFAMSIIILGCLFRKISGVLIPMLTVGVCIVWITGCFVLSGLTMNMISNMLLPLTFIIALSASIHLISYYYHESKFSACKEDVIYNTLRHVGIPILMTSITTAIGFLSLTTSSIPPIFITGLFMGGCAALTFIIGMTLIPILLSFVPLQRFMDTRNTVLPENPLTVRPDRDRGFGLLLSGLGRFIVNYRGYVLICSLTVGLFFAWGISKLQVESDLMASFPKHSQIARDNAYIERHLMGLLPVEIVAEVTNGISILQPGILNNLVKLQKYLHGIPEVTGSLSVANYIQKMHQFMNDDRPQYYSIPDTEKESMDYVKLASLYGDKYVNSLYAKGHTDARISVQMKQVGSSRYQAVIKSIKEYIHRHLDTTALSWHITGIVPLLINVQDNILRSEIQSFSLAFLLTFISTAVVLKSVKIGLISVIPNLFPSTITLGLMGLTGMKLDAATIMIASIALGISVDNTIHIFYRFKKEVSVSRDHSTAVCQTLQGVGKTALFTSLSAAFGFMVFSFSSFKPIQYFGVLTSVTLLNAIISDLFISPSCLMLFKPRF
ncbi:MAG: MMPL family transporter [Candidatus Brocadia sp.]|jgi:predicted RND superfamily exporter protein